MGQACYNGGMKERQFVVVVEKDKDGYFAFCPGLQGCYTQGDSYEEAMENIKDAVRLHVQDRIKAREKLPSAELVGVASVKIAV
jgi:predicted RNase H-like HicB family nuclease